MDSLIDIMKIAAGGVITLAGFWIKDVISKGRDNDKEVKIAEIQADAEEKEELMRLFQEAKESINELKKELKIERDLRARIESKFDVVKKAYKLIFKHYAIKFKDDEEQLAMLEELNVILDE